MNDWMKNPNFFVGILTIIILGAYIYFTATANPQLQDWKSWVDLLLGYWIKTVVTPVVQAYSAMSKASGSDSAKASSSSTNKDK